ncbi:MAG: RNA polymerase sigma factor [Pseudomonadota bacterium]
MRAPDSHFAFSSDTSADFEPEDGSIETLDCASTEVEDNLAQHLERLWRFALMRCADQEMADDLVQATCVRALEKAEQFKPGTRLESWLFSILESIWRNTVRAQGVRCGNGIIDIADAGIESVDASEDTRVELADTIRLIGTLSEGQRAVLLLVCAEGFTYAETAAILDVPIGTVMSRLASARSSLQRFG